MNIEYVRGLRDYFATLKSEQIDQFEEIFFPDDSDSDPCGCVGVHSAIFNNSLKCHIPSGKGVFSWELGKHDNELNGLTERILRKAYRNIGGRNNPFYPYDVLQWGVPVVEVLDEVIRMHSK